MAGDLLSTVPVGLPSPLLDRIDGEVKDALQGCQALVSEHGDAPDDAVAENVLALYGSFDEAARAAFFDGLVERFSVDPQAVRRAADAYVRHSSDAALRALQHVSEPPRRALFLRLSAAPGATARLVRMRDHLRDHAAWSCIDSDLTYVLELLFTRGVLDFQRIDLETPSSILERLIEAEAVHPVSDWREMGRRLEADRRCYAFFHPAWPQEPLIFTEVALTRGIASTIRPILDPDSPVVDPRTCDTAMFYSISNCQPGLHGFSLGNLLLTRVIERLRGEMPWLRQFATISPIPGFRSWLSKSTPASLADDRSGRWWPDERQADLLAVCAHYLLCVKRGCEPADPVARFHLGNGARLYRLNSSSDLSPAGLRRSAGLTVNYLYQLNELRRNAETYRLRHEVHAAAEVARLAQRAAPLLM